MKQKNTKNIACLSAYVQYKSKMIVPWLPEKASSLIMTKYITLPFTCRYAGNYYTYPIASVAGMSMDGQKMI